MQKLLQPIKRVDRIVHDSFQAYLVDGANFTQNEEYPIIPVNFVSKEIPQDIIPFSKAINYRGDLSNKYICFFHLNRISIVIKLQRMRTHKRLT